jgi:hypothetical protein
MWDLIEKGLEHNGLITAFAFVGVVMWISVVLSKRLTFGRIHGSAIAIVIGLVLAWVGGTITGGQKGLADLALFSGIGLMGGAMLRDFAIVATAFEVQATEARKAGMIGVIALLLGTILPFIVGASMAWAFGYRDAISMTTIGAGAVTYIVGPVTGAPNPRRERLHPRLRWRVPTHRPATPGACPDVGRPGRGRPEGCSCYGLPRVEDEVRTVDRFQQHPPRWTGPFAQGDSAERCLQLHIHGARGLVQGCQQVTCVVAIQRLGRAQHQVQIALGMQRFNARGQLKTRAARNPPIQGR